MGFFSTLMGSPSKGGATQNGFNALPESITGAYGSLGTELQNILKGNYAGAYTPTPLSTGEQSAIERLYKGFTPTQETLTADIGMQMNPYDSFVIDEINRKSGGDFSILKQQMDSAGQMGSNRGMLGANDIDLSRLNQIGSFKQSQYNTALQNALSTLPGLRMSDATGALGAGSYARDIDMGTSSAQITALQELAKAMGILPTSEGGGSEFSKGASGGLLGQASNIGGAISGIAGLFSDIELKENISHEGKENGFNIYSFNYIGGQKRFIGVMAQEVMETNPEAVGERNGYLCVNYDAIGVRFREAA